MLLKEGHPDLQMIIEKYEEEKNDTYEYGTVWGLRRKKLRQVTEKECEYEKEEKDDAAHLCRSLVFSPAKPSRSLQNIFVKQTQARNTEHKCKLINISAQK